MRQRRLCFREPVRQAFQEIPPRLLNAGHQILERSHTAIRDNCVAPGLIETDMGASMGPEFMKRLADEAYLKRVGQPEEIAQTVLFLLSERSSFTTGQTLVADGGRVTIP